MSRHLSIAGGGGLRLQLRTTDRSFLYRSSSSYSTVFSLTSSPLLAMALTYCTLTRHFQVADSYFGPLFPLFFLTFLSITAIHFFLFDFFDLSNSAPPDVSVAICSAHIIPLEETHSCFLNCRRSSLLLIFLSLCFGRRPPVVGIAIPAVVASQSCCLAKIFEGRKGEEEDGSLLVARAASKPIRIRNQSVEGWPSVVSSRMEPICQTICC